MQTEYFIEIRAAIMRRGPPMLVPLSDVHKYRGFRSVVAYDKEVAQFIHDQGSTNNLRGLPVYADTLFMDFDGHDPAEFRAWLQSSGLAYEEWDSGNRSVHYHIPIEPIYGSWVPAAMKAWVQEHAPRADISFYHQSGQYRLPHTMHYKQPGRCKSLVVRREGGLLRLSVPEPKSTPQPTLVDESSREHLFNLLLTRKGEGHRRPWLWLCATTAAEIGMSYEEALEHLRWWNNRHCTPPHTDDIIQRQAEAAYRRLARRA